MLAVTVSLAMLLQIAGAPGGGTAGAPGDEEQVCKRVPVTGSLVRKERACKTRAEWRRLSERGNSVARAIVEHSAGRPFDQQ